MAAISAVISAPVALISWVLALTAIEFNVDLAGPAHLITLGPGAAGLFQFAWLVTDIFGYCLFLAPPALYLWHWLQPRNPGLVTLSTLCGFAYILTGAITVSLLGGAVPPLMRAYDAASGPQREMLLVTFQTVIDLTFHGVGPLAYLLGGLWWLGTGVALSNERRVLGIVTIILGGLSVAYWVQLAFRIEPLRFVETLVLLLIPIWAVWLGMVIARGAERHEYSVEPAPAA
jgi:hypothetical protein